LHQGEIHGEPAIGSVRVAGSQQPQSVCGTGYDRELRPLGGGDMPRNELDYGLAHQMVAFGAVAADERQAAGGETPLVGAQVSERDAREIPYSGDAGGGCKKLAPVHLNLGPVPVLFLVVVLVFVVPVFVPVLVPENVEVKK